MGQSRNEDCLENMLGANNVLLPPMSRNEIWLHKILGEDLVAPEPQSRIEELLKRIYEQGMGAEIVPLSVTENGTYTADEGKAYSPVSVEVPNSYTAGDEGKVVSSGELVSQTAYPATITENDTYDTTLYDSVTVNVPPATPVATTISGTLAAPFGNDASLAVVAAALIRGFFNQGYNVYITIDASALGMGDVVLPVVQIYTSGGGITMFCSALDAPGTTLADASGASYTVTQMSSGAIINAALMLTGGQLVDISQYAAALPTVITYYGNGT